jgi:hypothetical protein
MAIDMVKVEDAAVILGVSEGEVRLLIRQGLLRAWMLPPVLSGPGLLVRTDDLKRLKESGTPRQAIIHLIAPDRGGMSPWLPLYCGFWEEDLRNLQARSKTGWTFDMIDPAEEEELLAESEVATLGDLKERLCQPCLLAWLQAETGTK